MAIGTKVKVGFDGSAVRKGLAGLTGGFTKLGRVVGRVGRQVAIGGARAAGQTIFGLLTRGATAIPQEIQRLAQYSAELRNVAKDSSIATSEVLAMQKALELQGIDTDLAADAFREFATKMGEAATDIESGPMQALRRLGMFQDEIRNVGLQDQITRFAQAVQDYSGSQQELVFILDEFLGGDLGLKAVGFFKDYNNQMKEGRRLTKGFADQLENSADDLNQVLRLRAVVGQKFSEFALGAFGAGRGQLGGLVERLERLDLAAKGEQFAKVIRNTIAFIREEGGIGEVLRNAFQSLKADLKVLGQEFGEGIKESLKGSVSPLQLFRGAMSKDKSQAFIESIDANTEKTNTLLDRMSRNTGARFA